MYDVKALPFVAIIDPCTNELLWRGDDRTQVHPLTALSFVSMALKMLKQESLFTLTGEGDVENKG